MPLRSAEAAERWFRRVCKGKAAVDWRTAMLPGLLPWGRAALWPPNREDDLGLGSGFEIGCRY